MAKVVLLVGLCGSGKTYLAMKLQQDEGYSCLDEGYGDIDAIGLSKEKNDELIAKLSEGTNCAYTEGMLMDPARRASFAPFLESIEAQGHEVEWIYFENNVGKANHNCLNDPNRDDKDGAVEHNNQWHHDYHIPAEYFPGREIELLPVLHP